MASLEILKLEWKWWNGDGEVGGDKNLKLGLWVELRRDWKRKVIEICWNNMRKKLGSIGKVWEMVEMKMCLKSWK
jgi:hypothetical protein